MAMRIVSAAQLQRPYGVGGDDRREGLIADPQAHLSEKTVDAHLVDEAVKAIARAQAAKGLVRLCRPNAPPSVRLLPRQQSIDLGLRDSMVPTFGPCRPHAPCEDPAFQGRVGHSEALSCGSDCDKCHPTPPLSIGRRMA